ncbi:hypothetical protein HMPREF0604_01619 [Neisseria mucosa C102]|uniref:Uncharacterized protein n=1 Tax=Neisseria mucosa C102 TaxID=435832 RepID=A0ABN0C9W5_NEIMU|nr:hypothetical protein HMPREF0604_01619 [Neisseria mucosa C102]
MAEAKLICLNKRPSENKSFRRPFILNHEFPKSSNINHKKMPCTLQGIFHKPIKV